MLSAGKSANLQDREKGEDYGIENGVNVINLALIFVGLMAVALSFFGCCTTQTKDRCSVCFLTLVLCLVIYVLVFSILVITFLSKETAAGMVQFCETSEFEDYKPRNENDGFFARISYEIKRQLYISSKERINRYDLSLTADNLADEYMCQD